MRSEPDVSSAVAVAASVTRPRYALLGVPYKICLDVIDRRGGGGGLGGGAFLQLAAGFARAAGQLGQLGPAEQDEDDDEQDGQLRRSEVHGAISFDRGPRWGRRAPSWATGPEIDSAEP